MLTAACRGIIWTSPRHVAVITYPPLPLNRECRRPQPARRRSWHRRLSGVGFGEGKQPFLAGREGAMQRNPADYRVAYLARGIMSAQGGWGMAW
jgi:hypothetical protein